MVDSTNKPVVIVIGTLGTGKSTVLNRLVNKDQEFATSDEATSCTQDFKVYHGEDYDICDSMGLGDPKIDLTKWMKIYNANPNVKGRKIALVLLVVKGQIRPTNQDRANVTMVGQIAKDLKPTNLAVVSTFTEETQMTPEKLEEFLEKSMKHQEDIKQPSKDHVFQLYGQDGYSKKGERLPKTTHSDFFSWFQSIVPKEDKDFATASEHLSVQEYILKLDTQSDMKVYADQMVEEMKEKDREEAEKLERLRVDHQAELAKAKKELLALAGGVTQNKTPESLQQTIGAISVAIGGVTLYTGLDPLQAIAVVAAAGFIGQKFGGGLVKAAM